MTTELPDALKDLPIYWQGVDDATPAGCRLVTTKLLGIVTTYVLRDEGIIGRVELSERGQNGYIGLRLNGGTWIGYNDSATLNARIAEGR
jgi:hypothetical protein